MTKIPVNEQPGTIVRFSTGRTSFPNENVEFYHHPMYRNGMVNMSLYSAKGPGKHSIITRKEAAQRMRMLRHFSRDLTQKVTKIW